MGPLGLYSRVMDGENRRIRHYKGQELFLRLLKRGRLIPPGGGRRRLPSLEKLLAVQPAISESEGGLQDVPLSRIGGSENRADDFTGDFYPRRMWMANRWANVYAYVTGREGIEPIELIEYGGVYFVRDGNHRVSVAKALGMEFITARVRLYRVALNLPQPLECRRIPLWKEMVAANREGRYFEILDPALFQIRRSGSWAELAGIIGGETGNGKEGPSAQEEWRKNSYAPTMAYIRENSLHYLFPRWGSTDIYLDFMKFCRRIPGRENLWLEEKYRLYSSRLHRRRFPLTWIQLGAKTVRSFIESREKVLERFRMVTRQEDFIPEFTLPSCTKKLVRYLYRQIYYHYALFLKAKYGRVPFIGELTLHWYRNYYEPLFHHYETLSCRRNFTAYYIGFSRKHFVSFREKPGSLTFLVREYCRLCPLRRNGKHPNRVPRPHAQP